MESLYVVKIGGNIVDDDALLTSFLKKFSALKEKKILVHGGGKLATRLAEKLDIPQKMVEGRRITDAESLKIVTMVYAGYINKNIVAELQSMNSNAIGITGVDGNSILAHKRVKGDIDYGYSGDIDHVNVDFLAQMLDTGLTLVFAPITHDGKNQLLNTNADTIAQELANSLSSKYSVNLIFGFEKAGVLLDVDNDKSIISSLQLTRYKQLKESGVIFAGMIPKLDNAFAAVTSGVHRVIIGKAEELDQLITGFNRNNHQS